MRKNHWRIFDRFACRRLRRALLLLPAFAVVFGGSIASAAENAAQAGIERLPDGWQAKPSEDSIYFSASSAALDDDALRVLHRHLAKLEAFPHLNITLVAHTDELGSTALEIARGQDRLNVVQRVLDEARIPQRRIRAINLGSESSPAPDCTDDACRRIRRRIDVLFHR